MNGKYGLECIQAGIDVAKLRRQIRLQPRQSRLRCPNTCRHPPSSAPHSRGKLLRDLCNLWQACTAQRHNTMRRERAFAARLSRA